MRRYRAAVRAFRERYPQLRRFQPWNEVNHVSQPTYKKPYLAVRYYDVLRKEAGCTTEMDYTENTSWLLFIKYVYGL